MTRQMFMDRQTYRVLDISKLPEDTDLTQFGLSVKDKKDLSQIQDVTLSNGTTVKAEDLRSAYKAVEEAIMEKTATEHNEINLYNPQVKGAILIGDSLSEIPAETLQFIREHNLPIFIMGEK